MSTVLNRLDLDGARRPVSKGRQAAARHPENKDRRKSLEGIIVNQAGSWYSVPRTPWQRGDDPFEDSPAETFQRVTTEDKRPWFLSLPSQWTGNALLPPLDEAQAVVEEDRRRGRAWQPWVEGAEAEATWEPREQVTEVLRQLGECLYPYALRSWTARRRGSPIQRVMTPEEAMMYPLHNACMFLQPSKVQEADHVKCTFKRQDYPNLELLTSVTVEEEPSSSPATAAISPGSNSKKRRRTIRRLPSKRQVRYQMGAHRFVCWARHGPPLGDPSEAVAMHSCDNKDCVNSGHLDWGDKKKNNVWPPPMGKKPRRR